MVEQQPVLPTNFTIHTQSSESLHMLSVSDLRFDPGDINKKSASERRYFIVPRADDEKTVFETEYTVATSFNHTLSRARREM